MALAAMSYDKICHADTAMVPLMYQVSTVKHLIFAVSNFRCLMKRHIGAF